MKISAVTLIRNEIDIVRSCIRQSRALFDSHAYVDMLSIDGTREVLMNEKQGRCISLFSYEINAKYQSEICERIVREHIRAGSDWVFLLDADEFLKVDSRDELEQILTNHPNDLMYMPWINLIPTKFGTFEHFNLEQTFRWIGRISPYKKVAISAAYTQKNPNFSLTMGNHDTRPENMNASALVKLGLPVLHIPVRSNDRIVYKAKRESIILKHKLNGSPNDGIHLREIDELERKPT